MAEPLRIGVNALFLIPGGVGGTEVYLRNILQSLADIDAGHEYFVFLNRETDASLVPGHARFHAVPTGVNAVSRPRRILWEQFVLPRRCAKLGLNVLYNPGFTSPQGSGVPNVTVIHDLQHHHHPEYFKRADLLAWRILVYASAKRSARLLTVSEASREDIHAVYGVPLERIDAAEPGVEQEFFSFDRSRAEPMVLCVSTLHPHKNLERLVDAFAIFRKRRPQYKLVLAGMRGFQTARVERRIAEQELGSDVHITGWLPRSEILELYRRAEIAVFPSLFEGFGMPVLEALAAGIPLLLSNVRPMTDTAKDCALLFTPAETGELAAGLEQLAADQALRADLSARGRERARLYTWERAGRVTLRSLEAAGRQR